MLEKHLVSITSEEKTRIFAVLAPYNLEDEIKTISRNVVGYVNKTFVLETIDGQRFVLRESNLSTDPDHLELEVEVLLFLESKGCNFTPKLIPNTKGRYIVFHEEKYYLLQNFMPGEIKASWNNLEHFTNPMLVSFFDLCGRFSRIVQGFKPSKAYKNSPLSYFVENGKSMFKSFFDAIPESDGKRFLTEYSEWVNTHLSKIQKEFEETKYATLPTQIVHFDLHPGNVHFMGEKAVALFDFDWVRLDSRISDIAAAIGQSCYSYGGKNNAVYHKDKIKTGLNSYRKAYGESTLSLTEEDQLIKIALKAYNYFQLLWAMDWYKGAEKNEENLFTLKTCLNVCMLNDYEQLFS